MTANSQQQSSSNSGAGDQPSTTNTTIRPTASSLQACKGKITELYARWMSSASGEQVIQSLIREALAASRNPQQQQELSPSPPTSNLALMTKNQLQPNINTNANINNINSNNSNLSLNQDDFSIMSGGASNDRQDGFHGRRGGTMGGTKFFASVDEVDAAAMHQRAHSPGASSPVSPNTAAHHSRLTSQSSVAGGGGGGGVVVDPSLPRGPQSSVSRDSSPSSDASRSPGVVVGGGPGNRFIDPIPMNLDISFGQQPQQQQQQQQSQLQSQAGAKSPSHHHVHGHGHDSAHHVQMVNSMLLSQDGHSTRHPFPSLSGAASSSGVLGGGGVGVGGIGGGSSQFLSGAGSMSSSSASSAALGVRPASFSDIPQFFFPRGQTAASASHQHSDSLREQVQMLTSFFAPPGSRATATSIDVAHRGLKRANIGPLCSDVFGLPAWMRGVVFKKMLSVSQMPDNGPTTVIRIGEAKRLLEQIGHLTLNRKLFEVIKGSGSQSPFLQNRANANPNAHANNVVTFDDLVALVRSVVDFHPGLEFLTQEEFQNAYCRTVAYRILFHHDPHGTRTVTWSEFNKSRLPDVLMSLDSVTDINQVLDYFSYEHFYVLYCRFWELDADKDLHVNLADLREYNQATLCTRALERVLQGRGRKLTSTRPGYMNFEDFVYFCLAEEDKTSDAAKRYWFHVVDIDGDGIISGYELNYFFDEQLDRLVEVTGPEAPLKAEDLLCQTLDMISPDLPFKAGVRLEDIRRCDGPVDVFFNLFINATKFLNFENRDPFEDFRARQATERTAWDRFARTEYDRLAQEAMQQ